MTATVHDPERFRTCLQTVMEACGDLFHTCVPRAHQAGTADDALLCFEELARNERATELLQVWLDLVRVTFEPNPPGTMLLNSNWDLVTTAVPRQQFDIGYLSMLIPTDAQGDIDCAVVESRMAELGYSCETASATFLMLSGAAEWYAGAVKSTARVQRAFGAGFTVASALDAICAAANGLEVANVSDPGRLVHVGSGQDEGLPEGWCRVSILLFMEHVAVH